MSSSNTSVRIATVDGCSELYLQDTRYRIVASGIGRIDALVPPGLYKLRQRIGDQEFAQVVEVMENTPLQLTLPRIMFASPIPLEGTVSTREYHQDALRTSASTGASHGDGQLALLVRDSRWIVGAADNGPTIRFERELAGLRIESFDGAYHAPLGTHSETRLDLGYVRLQLDLAPGSYVLVQQLDDGNQRCLPLIVLRTQALHVFLQIPPTVREHSESHADLDHTALVYALARTQLEPTDPSLLLLETARKALARGRTTIAPDIVQSVLNSKSLNPMLGLIGAHMLLNSPAPDASLGQLVVDHTAQLLGNDFPDIVALRVRMASLGIAPPLDAPPPVSAPPLLAASWHALTRAHADLSHLFWFPFTVEPSNTWFIWNEPPGVRAAGKPTAEEDKAETQGRVLRSRGGRMPELEDLIEELLDDQRLRPWVRELKKAERKHGAAAGALGPSDRDLLATVYSAQASLIENVIDLTDATRTIVSNLSIPARSARRSALKLLSQLEQWDESARGRQSDSS
jgi:hypothetical protein